MKTIVLTCDGCDAKVEAQIEQRQFHSFNGKGYGFGTYTNPTIDDALEPTGWMYDDPYTGCEYCPTCWAEIKHGKTATDRN